MLHVHDPEAKRTYTLQPLTTEMNPIFYHNKPLSFSYSTEEEGKICSWGIKILFEGEERSFANTFGRCITEMSRDEDFDKLEVEQQQSLLRGYLSDEEMEDAEVGQDASLPFSPSSIVFFFQKGARCSSRISCGALKCPL
jgi:hypothetical protein